MYNDFIGKDITMTLEIKKLDYKEYKGKEYEADITSDRCLEITPDERGFSLYWKNAEPPFRMTIKDKMLSDWLEEPIAYGAFEDDVLVGFIEGFHEKWNNRFRISNICVFDGEKRKHGIGTSLMKQILVDAGKSGARMAVLETQSGNYKAVSFYEKMGFEIIGFDRYAYSNNGPEENNMRIEMGMKL